MLLNRLQDAVDRTLRDEQAGFRRGRSCTEQVFTLRNIIEQSLEHQQDLIINFVMKRLLCCMMSSYLCHIIAYCRLLYCRL